MATYYINADTGNDTTGDGSSSNPWLTISHAKDNVVDGDTIFCQNSTATYLFEELTFNNAITIQGESVDGVVFSTVGDIQLGWNLDGDNYYTIKNITFSNINIVSSIATSVIYVNISSGTLNISSCIFKDINITAGGFSWGTGVLNTLSRYATYIVSGCIFYNITNRGIIVRKVDEYNSDIYTKIYFNNCIFNMNTVENTDILVGQNDPVSSFKNCIVYNNTANNKSISSYSNALGPNTTFDYNCVYGLFSNPITGTGNLLDTDPLFIDPENNNYNLSPSSPCIDAGTLI